MSEEYVGWLDDEWNVVLDQSQPIVRCRDCVNYREWTDRELGEHNEAEYADGWCKFIRIGTSVKGFCAWGKRRDDAK